MERVKALWSPAGGLGYTTWHSRKAVGAQARRGAAHQRPPPRKGELDARDQTVTRFPKGRGAWSRVQANALLRAVEDMFHRQDIEALVQGFTEDCVVRFAEQPELRGREALRALFTARLSRQRNYRLRKTLMALDGNVLANVWEGTWQDARTGKPMAGHGLEVWRMRDGMIAEWDAAFNVWEQGGERKSAIM